MYVENISRPSTYPLGTPDLTSLQVEVNPLVIKGTLIQI